ncbi:MAG: VOC family protein [bacterium]|nr:VOC family protein [bacterium]
MQEREQPETLRLRSVTPAITVGDVEKSVAWYSDVVGFIVDQEMRHEGELRGAVMRAGTVRVLLAQDDFQKGRDRAKGVGFRLYCATAQDVDGVAAAVKARGGVLDQEPTDQPWGARDFSIADPDGFKISISTGMDDE